MHFLIPVFFAAVTSQAAMADDQLVQVTSIAKIASVGSGNPPDHPRPATIFDLNYHRVALRIEGCGMTILSGLTALSWDVQTVTQLSANLRSTTFATARNGDDYSFSPAFDGGPASGAVMFEFHDPAKVAIFERVPVKFNLSDLSPDIATNKSVASEWQYVIEPAASEAQMQKLISALISYKQSFCASPT